MDRKIDEIKQRAKQLKMPNWDTIKASNVKNKRASIVDPSGKIINFGLWPYKGKGTYIDHKDDKIRNAWRARHEKIKTKEGRYAYKDPYHASFYSWWLLW